MTELGEADWLAEADRLLPGILPAEEFVARTAAAARTAGFASGDTLPLVATCRDELLVGFTELVDRAWGPHFPIGSLGGLVFAGVSGLGAAVGHAPNRGRRRVVLFAMPHVGIAGDGTVGMVRRPGQRAGSPACGPLVTFLREVRYGSLRLEYDRLDPEMSLLRTRLAPAMLGGHPPDLLTLTAVARDAAISDIGEINDLTGGDGAAVVLSGIVVHGPFGQEFVAPHLAEIRFAPGADEPVQPLNW
ncbi:hypothetical protein ACVBEQ_23515 [Nakamurella sp. GG22]